MLAVAHADVTPEKAYLAGRPVAIAFDHRSRARRDLRVQVERRGGRVAMRWNLPAVPPGRRVRLRWNGINGRGRQAREGRFRVVVGARGGRMRRIGSFVLRGHAYPVRAAHWFRGAIGTFGAPRNGGRTHEGFDINARCGAPVVAARGGVVKRRRYDPVLYGNYVIVRGARERRDYWYAHLRSPGRVREGGRVRTAARIGEVGATGNARSVGCHLHFELHGPGGPFDPVPKLSRWDTWS